MVRLGLIVLLLLQQTAPSRPPRDGAIHMQGHAYRLFCTLAGESVTCDGKGGAEVNHFEIRDETGQSKFHLDAPAGSPFAGIGMSGTNSQILTLVVSVRAQDTSEPPVFNHFEFYFETTLNGLESFTPSLTCIDGSMHTSGTSTSSGLGCTFPTDYFTFLVELSYDFQRHRIVLAPKQDVFYVLFPRPYLPLKTRAATLLELYDDHMDSASHTRVSILPGDDVKLLWAWCPVSIGPIENAPAGTKAVRFDGAKVWLKLQVNGQTGWIQGRDSFEAIGLDETTTGR